MNGESDVWRCALMMSSPFVLRLAPLSEGRVEADGTLLCAYHAWRFNGRGACTSIPQALNSQQELLARSNERACATAYPTRVEQVCSA